MFIENKIYNRKTDLHAKYGGNSQRGIAKSARFPIIFLFTSKTGKLHGYQDNWKNNGIFQYTGEGQYGNMGWTSGNLAIRDHQVINYHLHLFEKIESGFYRYLGEFAYIEHKEIFGDDTDSKIRKMIIFNLKKI